MFVGLVLKSDLKKNDTLNFLFSFISQKLPFLAPKVIRKGENKMFKGLI